MFRRVAPLSLAVALGLGAGSAEARPLDEPPRVVSYALGDASRLVLLRPFQDAATEQLGPTRTYLSSRWGRWGADPWMRLAWAGRRDDGGSHVLADFGRWLAGSAEAETPFAEEELRYEPDAPPPRWLRALSPELGFASTGASLASDGWGALFARPEAPAQPWACRRSPVKFVRYGGETSRFALVSCDGAVVANALDKLSIVARPPEVASPGELLPDEPDEGAWRDDGEWVPGVRMMNPRLLWVLQRIADALPRRPIYVYSGYRPHATVANRRGGHESLHARGRAMDIQVFGIPNAELFKVCRTLDDVGCGYYPNSKFVHVDVRRPRTGHAFWIDASGPGEPSRFVDSWPGVVDAGGLAWDARAAAADPGPAASPSPAPSP